MRKLTSRSLILCLGAWALAASSLAQRAPEPPEPLEQDDTFHFQATTVTQFQPAFNAPYSGPNSLWAPYESRTSLTSTLFYGHRLWRNASLYVNPEVSALWGLSNTHGLAAFPNGEIYRVDDPNPKLQVSRLYLQQVFDLGGGTEKIPDDVNQLAGHNDRRRLTVVAGKFSLNDFLDTNAYSHDPRTQFLNWALMDNGAWDYAADTRGYTWGLFLELRLVDWSFRYALALEPYEANQLSLNPHFYDTRGDNFEIERRYALHGHPGAVRLLAYDNIAPMGLYRQAIDETPVDPDITAVEGPERNKFGFGLDVEQEITTDLGVFGRAGWDNGTTETWAFTEIDRTLSAGAVLKGTAWHRPEDTAGAALIWDGLSKPHADYLSSGGLGFMLGDGALDYAPEEAFETYYSYQLIPTFWITGDYQLFENPGYNAARGPVHVFGLRLHYEI